MDNWPIDQGYSSNELRSDDEYLKMEQTFLQPASEEVEMDNIRDQNLKKFVTHPQFQMLSMFACSIIILNVNF